MTTRKKTPSPPMEGDTICSTTDNPGGDYHLAFFHDGDNDKVVLEKQASSKSSLQVEPEENSSQKTPQKHLFRELFDYIRYRNWKKKLLTVALALSCVIVFYDLFFGYRIKSWLTAFLEWMSAHSVLAVFAFIGIFVVSTLIFIPPSILIFGAGFAFAESSGGNVMLGLSSATIACFVGSCIGAIIAFFRARYMMRDLVHLFAKRYPIVRAFDKAFKRNGFRVMLLLRLCPLIPFNGLNYIGGVTGVKWEEFTLALIGILPSMLLMVAIGATAGSIAMAASNSSAAALTDDDDNDVTQDDDNDSGGNVFDRWKVHHQLLAVVLVCAGLACGVIAVIVIWHFAKKELVKEMEQEDDDKASAIELGPVDLDEQDSIEAHANGALNYTSSEPPAEGIEANYQEGVDDEEWFWIWA